VPKRSLRPARGGTGDARLGRKIRELRLAKNMSQQDLAQAVSARLDSALSQEAISHYETGLKMPPLRTMSALAQVLETTVDGILGAGRHPAAERVVQEYDVLRAHDDLARLVNEIVWQGGTPAMQEELAQMVRRRLEALTKRSVRSGDRARQVRDSLEALVPAS